MIFYEKAKQGKQLMKQFIKAGRVEEAVFIGLLYQTPIRAGDIVKLHKSDIVGTKVIASSSKFGNPYTDLQGYSYRITTQLKKLICVAGKEDGTI